MTAAPASTARSRVLPLISIGVVAGILSGLFGVGGGVIVVPALMVVLGMNQRRASGTSLIAIAPASVVGAATYAINGNVHLLAAALIAVGSITGSQIGVRLLRVIADRVLPWLFAAFIAVVIASLFFAAPSRGSSIEIDLPNAALLVGIGLIGGVLSGLVGVGGGVVVVPGLEVVLGVGDLVAKGTSLAMMIPTAVSGTVSNLRRGNADLGAGLTIGITASVLAPVGALIAAVLAPTTATVLFICFLVIVAGLVIWRSQQPRTPQPSA
ncbi:sulfite exporter TauE/SafE family protein [Curtobacterium pusillum]|uniref:sulfite exporter TauE/SafE family protein n=1 Tax=Curtobacterium pusillum TaxID=69373 RepID=UPI001C9318AA|nr:sulfite exporter TauE/SafE family protein [Curtobacterium pusillum]